MGDGWLGFGGVVFGGGSKCGQNLRGSQIIFFNLAFLLYR